MCPDLNKHLTELETNHGLNLRNDIAAPLGGEYAFALMDRSCHAFMEAGVSGQRSSPFTATFERVVDEVNKETAKEGKQGLEEKSESGGAPSMRCVRGILAASK